MCTSNAYGNYSQYRPYIGPVGQQMRSVQIGHGWGTYFESEYTGYPEGYSFTPRGVQLYLKIHEIQARIFDTKEVLNAALGELNPNQSKAFIISADVLDKKGSEYHLISLFAQKRDNRLLLVVNDSNGFDYPYDQVRKAIDVPLDIQLYVSKVKRQISGFPCQTYAIQDCKQFNKDPNLIDKLLEMNGHTDDPRAQGYVIDKLPDSLNVSVGQIQKKGQKYFDSLVAHLNANKE